MKRVTLVACLATALAWGQSACAAADFNPARLKGPRIGAANEVLVLGSPHLSQLPKTFAPSALGPLIERLRAWQPRAIGIEALSGTQCAFMRQYPQRYQDTVATYCSDPAAAREATGLDVPAATAEAERLLASWPASPTPAERRRLAAVFMAGGEPASALVQWLRLPETERQADAMLTPALVTALNTLQVKRNESMLIAAPLAAQLGHERLYAYDDHTADKPVADQKLYGEAVMKAWDNRATARRKRMSEALEARLDTGEGVLAMYRMHNAPGIAQLIYDSDFGAALEEPSPQRFGRAYVSYWETRNLRMASNLREAIGERAGGRMLVVVGGSHKGYLDAYLNQMHDVRIADAARLLQRPGSKRPQSLRHEDR